MRHQNSPARLRASGSTDIIFSASLWGTTGTVRTFSPSGAGAISVGAARIILGGMLLLALAARSGTLGSLLARPGRDRALLALGAVCVAVYQTAFFAAVARTGVAVGTVVTIGTGPVSAGLLVWLLGRNRPALRWAVSTLGAVAGCAALMAGGPDAGADPAGIALALLSGFTYAVYTLVASRFIMSGTDRRAVMGVLFGGAAILLTPLLLATSPGWVLSFRGGLVVIYLGAITTTFGYVLYARGLRTVPAATATTLTLAEPAVATLLGVVVLGERLGWLSGAGLGLLGASLALLLAPGVIRPQQTRSRGGARFRPGS